MVEEIVYVREQGKLKQVVVFDRSRTLESKVTTTNIVEGKSVKTIEITV